MPTYSMTDILAMAGRELGTDNAWIIFQKNKWCWNI